MSFYCWLTYKGIIKEEYRNDIEKAVHAKNWAAIESKKLRKVLSDFMELDNEDSVLNRMFAECSKLKRAVSFEKETGFLPFITKEILAYYTGDEGMKKGRNDNER